MGGRNLTFLLNQVEYTQGADPLPPIPLSAVNAGRKVKRTLPIRVNPELTQWALHINNYSDGVYIHNSILS